MYHKSNSWSLFVQIDVCYLIENWSKFIVCLSQFLKICQIFPVSNYLDTGILYGKSITNKRFVKHSLKMRLNWSLFNKSTVIREDQTWMMKDLVKKSSYDIVFSFIYSFPLNPLFFFSFEQLVWHSISFKRAGIKIKIFIQHKFGSWTFFIHN